MKSLQSNFGFAGAFLIALVGTCETSPGASITINGPYHYLDNRSANSININPGLFQTFGAVSVVPNGNGGTTGTATQGGPNLQLNFTPFDTLPNHFVRSRPATNPGPWTLNFTNGVDTATASTPDIAGASPIGFASAMSMSGAGNAPTFSWTAPSGAFDTQRVVIRDTTDLRGTGGVGGAGVANIIYSQDIGPSATSFTVNPLDPGFTQQLAFGRLYSFELQTRDLRDNLGGTGLANTLSQSRSFFDFMLLPGNAPGNVFLPTTNTANPAAPVFEFHSIPVAPAQPVFIDPLVAVGYDYQIGVGDPMFASVTLPTGIGDNLYQLLLWNGTDFASAGTLTGGVEHFFGGLGVDRFRILGIEMGAGIDPFSPIAFITTLTFASVGTFSGTMTPLTAEIPIPAALPLFATGLGVMGWLTWRRKRRAAASAAA